MFFSWLRSQVKAAILAGASDALEEMGEAPGDAGPSLRERLAALPPRAEEEAEANGNGRARKAKAG